MRQSKTIAGTIGIILTAWLLAGCGQQDAGETAPPAAMPPAIQSDAPAAIAQAIASTERLAGDADEDARRHPREVLEFLGVEPGMRVLDFLAGGGYYTELLSRVVGPDGTVIAYNNNLYTRFFGPKLDERLSGGRLANVRPLVAEPNDLALEPGELDAVLLVMSYHDLYHRPGEGEVATDIPQVVARLFQALKGGGTLVVQDHVAAPGSDIVTAADTLHRIDPETVKRDFTAAGFEFEDDSALFANAADDHLKGVYDESIRGQTDRFMLRFRKPVPVDAPRAE